jgi:hypothetical protein
VIELPKKLGIWSTNIVVKLFCRQYLSLKKRDLQL